MVLKVSLQLLNIEFTSSSLKGLSGLLRVNKSLGIMYYYGLGLSSSFSTMIMPGYRLLDNRSGRTGNDDRSNI